MAGGMRYALPSWPSLLVVLALALLSAIEARASAPAQACEQAAIAVAAETGVPAEILGALTLTETGRRRDGVVRPWAWSVNAEGSGTWFDDPDRALAFAEDRVAQGRTNLDIGCFQINYRWHGENFASVAEMFDPMQNTRYAARFLSQLHAEMGDWRKAAGAFHSRSPAQAQKYLARFDTLYATLADQGWAGMTGPEETYNSFAGEGGDRRIASADDGGFLAVGVEVPVPDMTGTGGSIDVSLDGSNDVLGGGDGGWTAPDLPGAALEPRRRRAREPGAPRTLLGSAIAEGEVPQRGSLAMLGQARTPMLQGGRALFGAEPPVEAVAGL